MTRVYVVVEGLTEESFVKNILAPTLWIHDVYLTPIILGPPGQKGGRTNYQRVKKDVVVLLKQDPTAFCSTMLDLYGLGEGFPGFPLPQDLPNLEKVARIERAFKADIVAEIADRRPDTRFIPYFQLHEYEGLLFSDARAFAKAIGQEQLAGQLEAIRRTFPTPEDINDDAETAPSKRVLKIHSRYRKVLDGTLAAQAVGVEAMRRECPHFREWLNRLEGLGG